MNPLVAWARERENIRLKKERGDHPPWTDDPILANFRFTNFRREDDKVTRWIAQNWRLPHVADPDLWFAMTAARHVNLPETLSELGYPVPWKSKRFVSVIRRRKERGTTAYNAAYMIRAASGTHFADKAEYLAKAVFGPLWRRRARLRPTTADTLESFHGRLSQEYGLGSFMAGQVVADVKFVPPLLHAPDFRTFLTSGPGSRRGLNRILGKPVKSPWNEAQWRLEAALLRANLLSEFEEVGLVPPSGQDFNNLLCEYDKYERARLGEGRPKQKYVPETVGLFK